MKVSVALHSGEPDPHGNQRACEAAYQNYNRQYADLEIDAETGGAISRFTVTFPMSGEPFRAYFFSIGVCIAPPDLGGSIILYGPINEPLGGDAGTSPTLQAALVVDAERMKSLDLVVKEADGWREKTEDELRNSYVA